jgi:hexokinase
MDLFRSKATLLVSFTFSYPNDLEMLGSGLFFSPEIPANIAIA